MTSTVIDRYSVRDAMNAVLNSTADKLRVEADLNVGDIEIGAVELKDGSSDLRAKIKAASTAPAASDNVLLMQPIDKSGNVLTGGSASGGGFLTYILTSDNAFGHGTTAYTAATQFTIAGYGFTVNPRVIDSIERYSSAGVYQETITPKSHTITFSAGVFTVTGMSATAGDLFVLRISGAERTVDTSVDSQKVIVQNPRRPIQESIVDTTNVATGTYYPSATGKSIDAWEHLSITGKLIDGAGETTTLTVEVTNDEDTTNGDWVQIYGFDAKNNANVNSISATNQTTTYCVNFDVSNWEYVRYLITTSAATNTIIVKERRF